MKDLLTRLQKHIMGMAPHQKERQQGELLIEAYKEIKQAEADKNALAYWLKASLECKSHVWEPDQRAVAQLLIDDVFKPESAHLEEHKIKAEDTPS